jgi:ubiquinone/menaquinone biosynthesis C-methylase UbiE
MSKALRTERDFTPAVPILSAYDPIVSLFTRERRWRSALLAQVAPRAGEAIVDVGCGTGSFLALLGATGAPAQLVGIDPDDRILDHARAKLSQAGLACALYRGYLREAADLLAPLRPHKIVSSLVLHQVPLAEKRAGLAAIHAALRPGGELHIADYGLQRTRAMRMLFRLVQAVDGTEDTQPNADGIVPVLMQEEGFIGVAETLVIPTLTGSISLYRGSRAP